MSKTNKMFQMEELEALKNALPGKYYQKFRKIWGETHKKDKCPMRQNVYSVLSGASENDKIIEVLILIVQERKQLKEKLLNVTTNVRQPEATAAH
jgi:hypothetical protein